MGSTEPRSQSPAPSGRGQGVRMSEAKGRNLGARWHRRLLCANENCSGIRAASRLTRITPLTRPGPTTCTFAPGCCTGSGASAAPASAAMTRIMPTAASSAKSTANGEAAGEAILRRARRCGVGGSSNPWTMPPASIESIAARCFDSADQALPPVSIRAPGQTLVPGTGQIQELSVSFARNWA